MKTHVFDRFFVSIVVCLATASLQGQVTFLQTNLVSDIPGLAAKTDSALVNPWGISLSGGSPFWVSNAGSGVSKLYNGSGTPAALVVTIPPGAGAGVTAGVPTGQVFNGGGAGVFNGDLFIFASQTGSISGWRGALGTNAELLVDNSGTGAAYTGIALGSTGGNSYLYAANFGQGKIDVIPNGAAPLLPGNFSDPTLPAGYSPFNIQRLGANLFVNYALQDPGGDETKGAGLGIVNQFNLDGQGLKRIATGGVLNAPWGLAVAPSSFQEFGGDLLVGNFGDGTINAFNMTTGVYAGTLNDSLGNPIVIDGLWGITPGNGGQGGSPNKLYFAAGIQDESHGLFGSLATVPDASPTWMLLGLGCAALGLVARRLRWAAVPIA